MFAKQKKISSFYTNFLKLRRCSETSIYLCHFNTKIQVLVNENKCLLFAFSYKNTAAFIHVWYVCTLRVKNTYWRDMPGDCEQKFDRVVWSRYPWVWVRWTIRNGTIINECLRIAALTSLKRHAILPKRKEWRVC